MHVVICEMVLNANIDGDTDALAEMDRSDRMSMDVGIASWCLSVTPRVSLKTRKAGGFGIARSSRRGADPDDPKSLDEPGRPHDRHT